MKLSNIHISDYIRTFTGEVGLVLDLTGTTVITDSGDYDITDISLCKHKLNDLVQEHDFVNGARVSASKQHSSLSVNGHSINDYEIQQFMTKEYFYAHCYAPKNPKKPQYSIHWKPIKYFPNYEVSNSGLVRVIKTKKILSYLADRDYLSVRMENSEGHRIRKHVAVLVLETFKEPGNGRIPQFIDHNIHNCSLDNLRWEDRSEQAKRVLPKKHQAPTKYKYHNIIGFINDLPVIYGNNSRDIFNLIKLNCNGIKSSTTTHLTRAITSGASYYGIYYKMVSDEEFATYKKQIDLSKFPQLYKDLVENAPQLKHKPNPQKVAKPTPKAPPIKKPTQILPPKPRKDKLADLDDADFFKEQEELKRNRFKEELLKRLNS